MPKPRERTRSKKRVSKSLPGSGSRMHYRHEVTAPRLCSICDQPLAGIQHVSPSGMSKLNRSKRRVWRPYGGEVCPNCLKNSLKQAARDL